MYKRILIANRGEIALRIIRACREMGIETVAIFSEADRGSAYLELADDAICVGPAKAAQSYLKIDRVISAAEVGNVEAIHPRHPYVQDHHVRERLFHGLNGFPPIRGQNRFKTFSPEAGTYKPADLGLVINNQNARLRH